MIYERILYMKYPIFASFIVFCIWLAYEIRKSRKAHEQASESFWEREAAANNTRRKSLDGLAYIRIPFESFPMDLLTDDPRICEIHETLRTLSDSGPIVNLTGISNTDLKLQYGAPNINLLTLYDQKYTTLARTLQDFASVLYERGYHREACQILEFAVSTHTDVSSSYKLLISLYAELGQEDKIAALLPVAESLNSSLKPSIVRMIQDACSRNSKENILS